MVQNQNVLDTTQYIRHGSRAYFFVVQSAKDKREKRNTPVGDVCAIPSVSSIHIEDIVVVPREHWAT